MAFSECGETGFSYPDEDIVSLYGINKLICLKNQNYSLQGDYYSRDFKYLEIKLFKCNPNLPTSNCSNTSTINSFFENLDFSVAFVNSYFDFSDYEQPIKQFIDD